MASTSPNEMKMGDSSAQSSRPCDLTSSGSCPQNDRSPFFPSLCTSPPAPSLFQGSRSSAAGSAEADRLHQIPTSTVPARVFKIPLRWLEGGRENEHVVHITGLSESAQAESVVRNDLERMSITPRCIKERHYENGPYFVETYSLEVEGRTLFVRRFAINLQHEDAERAWSQICDSYRSNPVREKEPKHVPPLTNVERGGLALASSRVRSSDEGAAAAEVFDLFVRSRSHSSKARSVPEVHSATLVKVRGHTGLLMVLDPNNSEMSSVLSSADIRAIKHSYRVYRRVSPYDNDETTGRGSNQFRDCVDIAVKLAFRCLCETAVPEILVADCEKKSSEKKQRRGKGANGAAEVVTTGREQPPSTPLILPPGAVSWEFIRRVTNQLQIDNDLLGAVEEHPWRAGQSSDFATSDAIRGAVKKIKKEIVEGRGGECSFGKLKNALASMDLSLYDLGSLQNTKE